MCGYEWPTIFDWSTELETCDSVFSLYLTFWGQKKALGGSISLFMTKAFLPEAVWWGDYLYRFDRLEKQTGFKRPFLAWSLKLRTNTQRPLSVHFGVARETLPVDLYSVGAYTDITGRHWRLSRLRLTCTASPSRNLQERLFIKMKSNGSRPTLEFRAISTPARLRVLETESPDRWRSKRGNEVASDLRRVTMEIRSCLRVSEIQHTYTLIVLRVLAGEVCWAVWLSVQTLKAFEWSEFQP